MTNATIKAFLDEFGDRVCGIYYDNNSMTYINYKDSPKRSDIKLETKGGTDFIVVHFKRRAYGHPDENGQDAMIEYDIWHPTECVQMIVVMDENSVKYGIDPAWTK